MFNVLQPSDRMLEGCDDNNPVRIGIPSKEFSYLLDYLYDVYVFLGTYSTLEADMYDMNSHDQANPSLAYLLSVLKLSKMYQIGTGSKYTITTLPSHPDFNAPLQMLLTQQFDIPEWVAPTFRSLIAQPLTDITINKAVQMGSYLYYVLSQTKKHINDHRINVVFYPPQLVGVWQCKETENCAIAWDRLWWDYYVKYLLHPDNPKSCREAMVIFKKAPLPKMCRPCCGNSIEGAWAAGHVFEEEDHLVGQSIDKLKRWMNDL